MTNETEITLDDLLATVSALDSWVDAFEDDDENDIAIERVRRVIARLNSVIAEMRTPARPRLRLVAPPEPSPKKENTDE